MRKCRVVWLAIAASLVFTGHAAAQSVQLSAGLHRQSGQVATTPTAPANVGAPTTGYDLGISVRAMRWFSIVAEVDHGSTDPVLVRGAAGVPGHVAASADETFSVTDLVAGVKLSRNGTGPFAQLLAGRSHPGVKYGAGTKNFSLAAMDQGMEDEFVLRPAFGFEFFVPNSPAGLRVEAGWDLLNASAFADRAAARLHHFRFGAAVVLALGPR